MFKSLAIALLICAGGLFAIVRDTSAQTTEFTYQGSLKDGIAPANANYDFEFALFDAASGGTQIGATLARNTVAVANGIFAVRLDFGSQFPGADRFLEIRVRQSGGGALTPLIPRQLVNSAPYSVKSLNADNATNATNATTATMATNAINAINATNATTAVNFSGPLVGDVTGTQAATTVARLQGRNVAGTAPTGGQVLKFNSGTNQWTPDTDLTGGGGGGTITGVTAGTGLSGGGTSGTVTVGIAPGGVGTAELAASAITTAKLADGNVTTAKLADANVTNAKIEDVAGGKITGSITTATISGANVTGPVANATNATTAVNFTGPLAGDVTGPQNATALANNAVTTPKLADSAVTAAKIASGQVVKSVTVGATTLTDNVTLAPGSNITITPSGNTLTIASTSGGIGGTGTLNRVPVWTSSTTLGDSTAITQSANGVQLPNGVQLAAGTNGHVVAFGSPNSQVGMTFTGATGRGDIRYNAGKLQLLNGPTGQIPPEANGIVINTLGDVGIGTSTFDGTKLKVENFNDDAISGVVLVGAAVYGVSGQGPSGVRGFASGSGGRGVIGISINGNGVEGDSNGSNSYFGVFSSGFLGTNRLGSASFPNTSLCLNGSNQISACGSSLRYKTDLQPFSGGLSLMNRLRPISFNWKNGGPRDLGFGAEDVAAVEPLLTFRNDKGEVEGVKYDRLSVVFVNAIKEQQAQIETQQKQVIQQQKQIATLLTANAALNMRVRAVEKRLPKKRGSARRHR